jgi:hypothetical protein
MNLCRRSVTSWPGPGAATLYGAINASRDDRMPTAFHSGVGKSEIARLSGIARTTVDRILDESDDAQPDGPATEHDLEEAP